MDDLGIINQTLRVLIQKIDGNPLATLKDAEQLSVDLADQHFCLEKKLRLILDELEQIDLLLSEGLEPHDRKGFERFRAELVEVKEATAFVLPVCKKLAENSDKIYHAARAERLNQ